MAVKIKLKRMGKIRTPYYRVVIADSRTKRDGRAIEEIGKYHPTHEPSVIQIDTERAQYWLKVGAQPTEAVLVLLKITGDWQKFKGLPGAEGTLRFAEPRVRQGTVPFMASGNDATKGRGGGAKTASAPAAAAEPAVPTADAAASAPPPVAAAPDVAAPDVAAPDVAAPDVAAPDAPAPDEA